MTFPDLNSDQQSTRSSSDPVLRKTRQPKDGYKRWFDLAALLIIHLFLAPIWIFVWTAIPLAIWLGDRQSVFYTQIRVGKNGKHFRMIKFRTMVIDAEQGTGPIWSSDQDIRVTVVGKLLRRLRLDEMPQVINIIRNEMSLVGPRPERPELVKQFTANIPGFNERLRVSPGFAGLAQIRGEYATRPQDKLRYDNLYITRMSPWLDTKIIFESVWVVLRGES